ncbi:DUF2255 family protein [Levilactobacillus suantsaiihabitans]|uniref:DUF2255 family protein n=1 Tax=Levilactobacillus suantsaiihabitans TaxID=2487722 RepID=A0A4Z0J5E3_9LACO|nr:DUF2255 family protein [Levilactobacillus suantsaiihabitans]TGD17674.1 DUF2255 family protein [Levilactobacillus suantsaiihabitans]
MDTTTTQWTKDQLDLFLNNKTLTMKPYNPDMTTFEEESPVWEVVVDGNVYSRGWNGDQTKWYMAATAQNAGAISVGDRDFAARFEAVTHSAELDAKITAAYKAKYDGQRSLPKMISDGPTYATLHVLPR